MNTNRHTAPTSEGAASTRKFAIAAGICYLITHATSVSAPFLYGPILNNPGYPGYITGSHSDAGVLVGAIFDVICAMAIVGTAVALFPVVKRQNEGIALGYVGLRTLEGGIIAVGAVSILTALTLRQMGTTADPATLFTLGNALAGSYKWTAMLGPGLVCGVNTVLMAYLMYRSRFVPRFIPVLGLVGGPLVFAYNTAMMFGLTDQIQAWAAILVLPIFAWEVSLAIRLIVKGFEPAAFSAMSSNSAAAGAAPNELMSTAQTA